MAAASIHGPIDCCEAHGRFELSGTVFDSLRFFGIGPANDGAAFLLIDKVTIDSVPLPAGLWLMGSACALLARFAPRVRR